ncbi:hypothetical protein BV22DRAFT_1062240 [Leucogyrophana mollusca]|uniref:Uncharacterized protein n=1 Tax=Leucogyrophana mollusca TaxID=85980 RepID=A0ACB8BNM9_9AGAM|nr:hypothetical protein BV22DRAFT_1062240 [Leucogyrophana mollusca]
MPEYVYALHDFQPEHEDEISFRAGQPIEVIERDDMYSDGWWQGRNLAGKVGLFPQSYTTPAAPTPAVAASPKSSATPPLTSAPPDTLHSPHSDHESPALHESDSESGIGLAIGEPGSGHGHGEVMKATMTDVQKAIEQLGRNDRGDARSFSFTSSRDGDTTDRETDTETDGEPEAGGEDWHRRARDKLAEQARKVVEAAAAADAESAPTRSVAPPIEVEMSDESEGEDDGAFDHLHHLQLTRDHPHIPEEEEEDEELRRNAGTRDHRRKHSNETSSAILPSDGLPSPTRDESGLRTAMAEKTSFSSPSPPASSTRVINQVQSSSPRLPTPTSPKTLNILSPIPVAPIDAASIPVPVSPEPIAQVTPTPSVVRETYEASSVLPSPAPTFVSTQKNSKHNSVASSGKVSAPSIPLNTTSDSSTNVEDSSKKMSHASEWSVEEVVEWLKTKGFGQDVCDKFTEQEITGDVLLELDINLLKAEIGIIAFGKRMRIANAIAELRRPPSIVFSDHQSPAHAPSHTHSQSYSYSHSHSSSTQHSLNSPLYVTSMSSVMGPPGSSGMGPILSPESPPAEITTSPGRSATQRISSLSSTGISINGGESDGSALATGVEKASQVAVVGLGLGVSGFAVNGTDQSNQAGQLVASSSDVALKRHSQLDLSGSRDPADDDRGALSDGETAASAVKQRRRLFGRSTESSASMREKNEPTNVSKDALSPSSATASPRPRKRESLDDASIASRHSRNKRSVDGSAKGSERLSFFGGTLGKSRKPAPRITSTFIDSADPTSEKSSSLSLRSLVGSRKVSGRPSTSDGASSGSLKKEVSVEKAREKKEKAREKEIAFSAGFEISPKILEKETLKVKEPKDSTVLRKRAGSPSQESQLSSLGPSVKDGKSILEQIGIPDHEGWMRKKGDHYNSWKVRYFVIKGPHLYILRSNSKAETKIKGYINIVGYKVIADENIDPGRYGFRIVHDKDKTHMFSSEEQAVVREWMKAIMKATIGRDYTKPVVSSVNIPTIPLTVAQAMNPAPRPPSPTARAATQKALRRENPNQLSTRDARILMGLPSPEAGARTEDPQDNERARLDSFFANQPVSSEQNGAPVDASTPRIAKGAPPRPSREMRHLSSSELHAPVDSSLIEWANSHLPPTLQVTDAAGSLYDGLAILRLAESILGKPSSPPVPDSAFPSGPHDDKLDGLFRLFDFLLDNDVKMGSVSINDVRQGKRDKVIQLLKALKAWEDRRREILRSIGHGAVQAGPFMAPVASMSWK